MGQLLTLPFVEVVFYHIVLHYSPLHAVGLPEGDCGLFNCHDRTFTITWRRRTTLAYMVYMVDILNFQNKYLIPTHTCSLSQPVYVSAIN